MKLLVYVYFYSDCAIHTSGGVVDLISSLYDCQKKLHNCSGLIAMEMNVPVGYFGLAKLLRTLWDHFG